MKETELVGKDKTLNEKENRLKKEQKEFGKNLIKQSEINKLKDKLKEIEIQKIDIQNQLKKA